MRDDVEDRDLDERQLAGQEVLDLDAAVNQEALDRDKADRQDHQYRGIQEAVEACYPAQSDDK